MYVRLFPGIKCPDMSSLVQKVCALFYIYGFGHASENLLLPTIYKYINFLMLTTTENYFLYVIHGL